LVGQHGGLLQQVLLVFEQKHRLSAHCEQDVFRGEKSERQRNLATTLESGQGLKLQVEAMAAK
jgi:hypothetical protein